MGLETNPSSASASASASASTPTTSVVGVGSPSCKRSRDPEDEVYLDNLHSHKRYLSEIMASSLNGLTVGDSLPENLMDSPARSENMFYQRDELSLQYSPMSEDSDDSRYYETLGNTCTSQPDSIPTSPVSPYRYQRPLSAFPSGTPTNAYSYGSTVPPVPCSQPRQRGSDSEGRFPSSPSDICHSADLRRAALLRSVQMRTQPPGPSPFELSFTSGQEPGQNIEVEQTPCSYMKSYGREYHHIEECPALSISESENREKSCRVLNMNLEGDNSTD